MNTTPATLNAPTSTRVAGAGFAALLTLAMLLGVGSLAQVDVQSSQLAKAPVTAASAAQS